MSDVSGMSVLNEGAVLGGLVHARAFRNSWLAKDRPAGAEADLLAPGPTQTRGQEGMTVAPPGDTWTGREIPWHRGWIACLCCRLASPCATAPQWDTRRENL